jgi:hypothetical protein
MTRRAYLRYSRGVRLIGISVATAALAAGCARDPVEQRCPAVGEDDLVVTEFRGQQSPDDGSPTWVELYNATTSSVDLEGTKVRFRKKDGSSEVDIIVRRSVTVAAGGYATLGLVPDDPSERPDFIDYGFVNDFHVGFLPAAAVDVEACGTRVDRATYDVLPKTGSYSLGTNPPNADDNDAPTSWCTNATPAGTPKQANPACP